MSLEPHQLVILTDGRNGRRRLHKWKKGSEEGLHAVCGLRFKMGHRELSWYFLPFALVNPSLPLCERCWRGEGQ
jgi:hypothetical protein